jgi:hypothetical protein
MKIKTLASVPYLKYNNWPQFVFNKKMLLSLSVALVITVEAVDFLSSLTQNDLPAT